MLLWNTLRHVFFFSGKLCLPVEAFACSNHHHHLHHDDNDDHHHAGSIVANCWSVGGLRDPPTNRPLSNHTSSSSWLLVIGYLGYWQRRWIGLSKTFSTSFSAAFAFFLSCLLFYSQLTLRWLLLLFIRASLKRSLRYHMFELLRIAMNFQDHIWWIIIPNPKDS